MFKQLFSRLSATLSSVQHHYPCISNTNILNFNFHPHNQQCIRNIQLVNAEQNDLRYWQCMVFCPGGIALMNDNSNSTDNDDEATNAQLDVNKINTNTYKLKRNYSSVFLKKPKDPNPKADEVVAQPSNKKRRFATRGVLTGPQRAQIIRYA